MIRQVEPIQESPTAFERLPPHDLDAEICTLASLAMCENDLTIFTEIRSLVSSTSFFSGDYSEIFKTLDQMEREGERVDTVTLRARLIKAGIFEEVGGAEAIAKMYDTLPGPSSGPSYARIVKEKSALRDLIAISNDTLRQCYAPSREMNRAASIADSIAGRATEIFVSGSSDNAIEIGDVMLDVAMRSDKDGIGRMMTGLERFDRQTGGLGMGRMTLIGGRPGMGKSALLKQILLNCALRGEICGLITVEESRTKVAENLLSNLSDVENWRIAFGKLTAGESSGLCDVAAKNHGLKIIVDDVSCKLPEIESSMIRLATKHECRMIGIDYLQLIEGAGDNENREITQISKGIKMAIKRLNVAGVVACQLNRGGDREIRKPTLKDLRGSGSLEQDGDLIALLHREDYYHQHDEGFVPTHQLEAIIAKNKDNRQCVIPLYFDGRYQRITDWPEANIVQYDPSEDLP